MRKFKCSSLVAMCSLLILTLIPQMSSADLFYFSGQGRADTPPAYGRQDYNYASNWFGNLVPSSTDSVVFAGINDPLAGESYTETYDFNFDGTNGSGWGQAVFTKDVYINVTNGTIGVFPWGVPSWTITDSLTIGASSGSVATFKMGNFIDSVLYVTNSTRNATLQVGGEGDGTLLFENGTAQVVADRVVVNEGGSVIDFAGSPNADKTFLTVLQGLVVTNTEGTALFDVRRGNPRIAGGTSYIDRIDRTWDGSLTFDSGELNTHEIGFTDDDFRFAVGDGTNAAALNMEGNSITNRFYFQSGLVIQAPGGGARITQGDFRAVQPDQASNDAAVVSVHAGTLTFDHYIQTYETINTSKVVYIATTNLLRNPGFEETGEWQTFGNTERVDWRSYSGTWQASIRNWDGTDANGGWYQQVTNRFGTNQAVTASIWAYNDDNGIVYTSAANYLVVDYFDGGFTNLGSYTNSFALPGTNWTQVSLITTSPADTAWIKLTVWATGQGTEGALQLDDANLSQLVVLTNVTVSQATTILGDAVLDGLTATGALANVNLNSGRVQADMVSISNGNPFVIGNGIAEPQLLNGSFEQAGAGGGEAAEWGKWGNTSRENWQSSSGFWQATIRNWAGTDGNGGWYQQITNNHAEGTVWTATADVWNDNGGGGGVYTAAWTRLMIKFNDGSSDFMTVSNQFLLPGESWKTISVTATAPVGVAYVKVQMEAFGQGTSGALQFDSVTLEPLDDYEPKLLLPQSYTTVTVVVTNPLTSEVFTNGVAVDMSESNHQWFAEGLVVSTNAVLSGGGVIHGDATIEGRLSPDSARAWNIGGLFTFADNLTFEPGSEISWEYLGEYWNNPLRFHTDHIRVQGSLTINATTNNPMNLFLGNGIDFEYWEDHSYLLASAAGGIIGFDADAVVIRMEEWTKDIQGGRFFIEQETTNLWLRFYALNAPAGLAASDNAFSNKIELSWNSIGAATRYEVWRNTLDDSGSAAQLDFNVSTTNYTDSTVVNGQTYWYWIKAANDTDVSDFSAADTGVTIAAGNIPGWWWAKYGLSSTNSENADNDSDLSSNLDEYIFDTNPTNSTSVYTNRTPQIGGGNIMTLQAGPPTSTGRVYDVFWSTNLSQGVWTPYGFDIPGNLDNSAVTLTVTNDVDVRMYRTGVKLP